MRLRQSLILGLLIFIHSAHSSAQTPLTAEKRADIETMLELTDALALGQQLSQAFTAQMAGAIGAGNPDAPPGLLDAMREIVDAVLAEELPAFVEEVILIYDRHFTHEEIRGFNEFYSSELGRKAISLQPQIAQQSIAAGQVWGQALQPEIERRLRAWMEQQGTGR